MRGDDWVEIGRFGEQGPVRRVPTASAYWYAVGVIRQRRGLEGTEPLPPGVYLVDDGDAALVIQVDDKGGYTFGFDAGCPAPSEWAGTPPEKHSAWRTDKDPGPQSHQD